MRAFGLAGKGSKDCCCWNRVAGAESVGRGCASVLWKLLMKDVDEDCRYEALDVTWRVLSILFD